MKKLLAILFVLMAFGLVMTGCDTGSNDKDGDDDNDPAEPTYLDADGKLNLSLFDGYSAADGGIVATMAAGGDQYLQAYELDLSEVAGTANYSRFEVVAEVYQGATLVDIASNWGLRVMVKVNNGSTEDTNMGVAARFLSYGSTALTSLNFYRKENTITKIVIKEVNFAVAP